MSKFKNLDSAFRKVESTLIGETIEIRKIEISLIDEFEGHPFSVNEDEDMLELVTSIKEKGQLTPVIVRQKENGRYEMVSGHRRKKALELAGEKMINAEVRVLSDDDAIIIMTDCNLQRSKIKPSEKAKAYKMKLKALKRQGERVDLTLSQVETKLRSDQLLANQSGVSRAQIQRYIRLTELIEPLLQVIDDEKMGLTVGVELSYLSKDEQAVVYEFMLADDRTPSLSQAQQLREISEKSVVTNDNILEVFVKPVTTAKNQTYKINMEYINKYIPAGTKTDEVTDIITKALEMYYKREEYYKSSKK